jgi:hypothetical protein
MLVAPRPLRPAFAPEAEVLTLRPKEPDEAIMDGGDFQDDFRAPETAPS